jgi:hypothetical protein
MSVRRVTVWTMADEIPDSNYSPVWADDTRSAPPLTGTERELLISHLEYLRETLALKCAGVPPERLAEQTMPPSTMTLHGLIRHLAGDEQWWFHYQFAGEQVEWLFDPVTNAAADFEDLSGSFDDDLATWRAMCAHSREITAAHSLEDTGTHHRTGEPVSLRRILINMIAEYARHAGHADLLREGIDGAVGQ